MLPEDIILTVVILLAAMLYAAVGHAGASGYLAAMALAGVSPAVMKPAALSLNILVALIATTKYYRVGAFSWPLFWPLVLTSIPFAFIGGSVTLDAEIYKPLVGIVLVYAACRAFLWADTRSSLAIRSPRKVLLMAVGAALGLLSGLTGVGGGIFLSPLLLFLRWAEVRVISGTAAAFILVNSIAGLLGVISRVPELPRWWVVLSVRNMAVGQPGYPEAVGIGSGYCRHQDDCPGMKPCWGCGN
ncbi:sulfite exporter TauE/SafE family protein [Porticoccus sp.]|uniref:sulfite exporter TauE/SafE family protein n=1 Tax=Porticoccus sp. TaxID=2024853 RepID=UPI003F69C7A8